MPASPPPRLADALLGLAATALAGLSMAAFACWTCASDAPCLRRGDPAREELMSAEND